jgi:hypothetical protein
MSNTFSFVRSRRSPRLPRIAAVLSLVLVGAAAQEPSPPRLEDRLIEVLQENKAISPEQAEELRRVAADYRRDEERRLRREVEVERELDQAGSKLAERAVRTEYRGKGLRFRTADDAASLEIGARIQVRYEHSFGEDDPSDDDQPSFEVARARLWFAGHVLDRRLRYRVMFDVAGSGVDTEVGFLNIVDDFTSDERFVSLRDAWLSYEIDPALSFRAGQFKTPYSRQALTGVGDQLFIERAITDDAFAPGRDVGVQAFGGIGGDDDDLFTYAAGVFNGEGPNRSNNDRGLAYAVRLALNPWGAPSEFEGDFKRSKSFKASLGVNAALHQNDGHRGRGEDRRLGADLAARYAGFSLSGEAHWLEEDAVSGDDPTAYGWLVQAGYALVEDRLEIALRAANVDWHDHGGADDARREYLIALDWYLDGHAVKWQLDFGRVEEHEGDGDVQDEWRLRLQFQLTF